MSHVLWRPSWRYLNEINFRLLNNTFWNVWEILSRRLRWPGRAWRKDRGWRHTKERHSVREQRWCLYVLKTKFLSFPLSYLFFFHLPPSVPPFPFLSLFSSVLSSLPPYFLPNFFPSLPLFLCFSLLSFLWRHGLTEKKNSRLTSNWESSCLSFWAAGCAPTHLA